MTNHEPSCYNDDGTRVGDQLEYEFPEMPERAKSLLDITETPLDVRPGGYILWGALLFASFFRQWAYTVLSSLYAMAPADYTNFESVRGATGLSADEYADIVYAYTIIAVSTMGVSGACAKLFGEGRTACTGLLFQVGGCVCCGLASGVPQIAVGTVFQAAGFGIFLTPAYSLVFGIERSGTRRVLATTTIQAASNLGTAAASMSVVMADNGLGWRGTYFVIATGLGISAITLILAPNIFTTRGEVDKPIAALTREIQDAAVWMYDGRSFFCLAIAASAMCGVSSTLEGTWITTYFLDNYPYYADLYSYLTASIITVGIGVGFLIVAGWLVDRIVSAALFGVPTILVVPGLSLICGAPFKLIAIVTNDDFFLAFMGEAIGKSFDTFIEAPLYVCLQLVSPPKHRPTVVGLFLFCYWVVAATIAEIINDAFGLSLYQILLVACGAQAAGGLGYIILGYAEYPAALRAATEYTHGPEGCPVAC